MVVDSNSRWPQNFNLGFCHKTYWIHWTYIWKVEKISKDPTQHEQTEYLWFKVSTLIIASELHRLLKPSSKNFTDIFKEFSI